MRDFNKPLAVVLSAAAMGSGMPAMARAEAPDQASAQASYALTEQQFEQCAAVATNDGSNNNANISAVDRVYGIHARSGDRASFQLSASQYGDISTGSNECNGVATLRDTLGVVAGKFLQVIRRSSVHIKYADPMPEYGGKQDHSKGVFSYARICRLAGSKKVSLVLQDERGYSEPQSSVSVTRASLVRKLPCN